MTLRSLWLAFSRSYDQDDALANSGTRAVVLVATFMCGVFLGVAFVPGLAELTRFTSPWVSVALALLGACFTVLSHRHQCGGTWGTLGCLLDNTCYVAAIAWAAANTSRVSGLVFSAVLAATLWSFVAQIMALTLLIALAITVPVVAIVLLVQPDPWVAVVLVAACAVALALMGANRQRGPRSLRPTLLVAKSGTRYRLGAVVGAGGMGVVFRGVDEAGRVVAIKRLHAYWLDRPLQHRRFLQEARIVNELEHPGIVPILDTGEVHGAGPFLVMPLLEGSTLRARVEAAGAPLGWAEISQMAERVLETLATAHDKGVTHCDVKPSNIFLCDDGGVKLLDFGIARPPTSMVETTLSVHVVGTPASMAPEQILEPASVDGRTDLWGVGATMFWTICREWPRAAPNPAGSFEEAARTPARPLSSVSSDVPEPLAQVIDRALGYHPEDRWQSAAEMRKALCEVTRDLRRSRLDGGQEGFPIRTAVAPPLAPPPVP